MMPCSDSNLTILSETEPVPALGQVLNNPKDKRRIRYIEVTGCLEKTPADCIKDVVAEGGNDFGFGHMKRFFAACGEAMRKAIAAGEPLADACCNGKTGESMMADAAMAPAIGEKSKRRTPANKTSNSVAADFQAVLTREAELRHHTEDVG